MSDQREQKAAQPEACPRCGSEDKNKYKLPQIHSRKCVPEDHDPWHDALPVEPPVASGTVIAGQSSQTMCSADIGKMTFVAAEPAPGVQQIAEPYANWDTEEDPVLAQLKYVASSPSQEHGGFHPQLIETAKLAIAEIVRLRAAIPPSEDAPQQGRDLVQESAFTLRCRCGSEYKPQCPDCHTFYAETYPVASEDAPAMPQSIAAKGPFYLALLDIIHQWDIFYSHLPDGEYHNLGGLRAAMREHRYLTEPGLSSDPAAQPSEKEAKPKKEKI